MNQALQHRAGVAGITAIALILLPSALHATEIQIYGQAHLAANYLDDGDDQSAANLSSNASRLGFRATHDFDAALRGIAQIEGQVDLDSGNTTSLTSRDSFLGLQGAWGLARAGFFDTPTKRLSRQVDLFGNQLGDSRNIVRGRYSGVDQGFDERFKNGIAYRSPSFGGVVFDLHYSTETDSGSDAADGNTNDAWSGSIGYRNDALYIALAHERNSIAESAVDERDVTRFAISYDLGELRLVALAQTATDPDDNAYGLGARYAVTPAVALKGQYYHLDADDSDFEADLVAVGVDYQYAPALRFYLNYAQTANGSAQTLAPWRESSTLARAGAADKTARGVALGAIYNF